MRERRRLWQLPLLAFIILLDAALLVVAVHDATHHSSPAVTETKNGQQQVEETLWAPATWSPTSVFTLILALVAVGQAFLFVWQLELIRQGASDAEEAADAARDTADALKASLAAGKPSLLVYDLDSVIKTEVCGDDVYEISYKIANVGRTSAVLKSVRHGAGIRNELGGYPHPALVPAWHDLARSPVMAANEVRTVTIHFPHDQIALVGEYTPDGGGGEFDYYRPADGLDACIVVVIRYFGAASDMDSALYLWWFDHEHNCWASDPDIRQDEWQ